MTLEQDSCKIMYNNREMRYQVSSDFDKCGGQMYEEQHNIVYTNIARIYYSNESTSNSLISRTKTMNIKLVFHIILNTILEPK